MDKRILLMAIILAILIVPSASATDTEYTSTTRTVCDGNTCGVTWYSTVMFARNSSGKWVNPAQLLSVSKYQDDITFSYDGIDGEYSITFEAGVIYNGNYFSFSQIKQSNPEIEFDFPHEDKGSYVKYAVNITNIDEINISLIEYITLTYKSHEGFNLNKLKITNKSFVIRSMLGLYFTDLLDKHPVSINRNQKRLYISNITENIIDGQLYLDPSVTIKGDNVLSDARIFSGANANFNYGSEDKVEAGNNGNRDVSLYIKFLNTLPVGVSVTKSTLWFDTKLFTAGITSTSAWGINNQTWQEGNLTDVDCTDFKICNKGITFNRQPETIVLGNLIVSQVPPAGVGPYSYVVTSWVDNQSAEGNISFYVNATDDGLNKIFDFHSKEGLNANERPFLVINYSTPDVGINISVFSAIDGLTNVDPWSMTMNNGSDILTLIDITNPLTLDAAVVPVGSGVNVTIFKNGYANATYNVSVNNTHLENVTAFIFTVARGLITIDAPVNGSSVGGVSLFLNITAPDNITGLLLDISYELNASGNFISLCVNCVNFSGFITLGGLGDQSIVVRTNSTTYGTWHEESSFGNLFATYDVLIMDELRNITFDMSLVEFANFTAFCPKTELEFDITKNLTKAIDIGCEFDYLRLRMKLFNQTAAHFRTLIPDFDAEQITFYMIDNITRDPDDNFVDVKLIIEDLTGNFLNGIVHIRKAINGSIVDIIDKQVDAQGAIDAYLVINERYRLSIESSDGRIIKDLRDLIIRKITETEIVIRVSDLDIFPPLEDFITWTFSGNQSELFINFTYNDTLSQTNYVIFNVYNITDPTNRVLVFSEQQNSSEASFSFSTAVFDNTYLAEFIASHDVFGEISETRIFIFTDRLFPIGLLELEPIWYQIISIFLLMMTALLFGARAAPWGAVVVAIEAGFFVMIGWLNITLPVISLVILIAVLSAIGYRRREQ